MSAYVIAEFGIADADAYVRYRDLAAVTIREAGGKMLVRPADPEALEGKWDAGTRIVLIEFEDDAKARDWYRSTAYQEAVEIATTAMPGRRLAIVGSPS